MVWRKGRRIRDHHAPSFCAQEFLCHSTKQFMVYVTLPVDSFHSSHSTVGSQLSLLSHSFTSSSTSISHNGLTFVISIRERAHSSSVFDYTCTSKNASVRPFFSHPYLSPLSRDRWSDEPLERYLSVSVYYDTQDNVCTFACGDF